MNDNISYIDPNSVINQIQLDYKPKDFYYYNSNLTPASTECDNYRILECDVSDSSWNDLSFNCYRKELCENRELANQVLSVNTTNLQTQTRQHDTMSIYQVTKLNTTNLLLGMFLMVGIMVYGNKSIPTNV